MRARQLSFLPKLPLFHGGEHSKGKRKTARAFDPKRSLHIVLRSSRARGEWSFLHSRNERKVRELAEETARKWDVRLYRYTNVGNHLHLLVKARTRRKFQSFLRELTGVIAAKITGARKGKPAGGFWDGLAFSRIVTWGRDFRNIDLYFIKNLFEASGLVTRAEKARGLKVIPILGWSKPPPARVA